MKIIHSLWTKPLFKEGNTSLHDRFLGGWSDKKYNYMSWALSCLQFKKFYPKVELVTDQFGKEILIDKLNLPYSNVEICLDELRDYHPDLWALGKVYAYSIQKEPFLHVDGDVYIWEKFDSTVINNELIAQNIEVNFPQYAECLYSINNHFGFIPESMRQEQKKTTDIVAYNAGIFGGTDFGFFTNYANAALDFVNKNIDKLQHIEVGLFNMIYEQYLFHCLATEQRKKVFCLKNDVNPDFEGLADFDGVPRKTKYIHAVGKYKKNKQIGESLERRLLIDYPEYYYKILSLIRDGEL